MSSVRIIAYKGAWFLVKTKRGILPAGVSLSVCSHHLWICVLSDVSSCSNVQPSTFLLSTQNGNVLSGVTRSPHAFQSSRNFAVAKPPDSGVRAKSEPHHLANNFASLRS